MLFFDGNSGSSGAIISGTGFPEGSDRDWGMDSLNRSVGAQLYGISKLNNDMSHIDNTAQGSFGVVLRARHDVDNQWYAVKKTKKEIYGEGDLQQRLQEVYALSACGHPNVVRYFDSWVEEKAVFMRMEFLPDRAVLDSEAPLSEAIVTSVLHQISSALHHLHAHGIIHRDVKPENILARRHGDDRRSGDEEYTFKLCDFGLARPVSGSNSRSAGEVFKGINDEDGDKNYLCPEALTASGPEQVGPNADIYALGATCVELMGGNPELVRRGQYTFDPSLFSVPLCSLVRRMTDQDPTARPDAFTVATETLDPTLRDSTAVRERGRRIKELQQLLHEDAYIS